MGLTPNSVAFSQSKTLKASEIRSRPATILLERSVSCLCGLNTLSFIKNACRLKPSTGKVSNPNFKKQKLTPYVFNRSAKIKVQYITVWCKQCRNGFNTC